MLANMARIKKLLLHTLPSDSFHNVAKFPVIFVCHPSSFGVLRVVVLLFEVG